MKRCVWKKGCNENSKFSAPDQEKSEDVEQSSEKKLKYPRAIPFIISNEFCERFNFYGMKAILVLYLTRQLNYGDDISTIIYHTFNVLVYFFCVFGGEFTCLTT